MVGHKIYFLHHRAQFPKNIFHKVKGGNVHILLYYHFTSLINNDDHEDVNLFYLTINHFIAINLLNV